MFDEYTKIIDEYTLRAAKEDGLSALDQAAELEIGCETWPIFYQPGNQRGQMTIWPNGRGAVCFGSDSLWGDWDNEDRILICEDSIQYNEYGEEV